MFSVLDAENKYRTLMSNCKYVVDEGAAQDTCALRFQPRVSSATRRRAGCCRSLCSHRKRLSCFLRRYIFVGSSRCPCAIHRRTAGSRNVRKRTSNRFSRLRLRRDRGPFGRFLGLSLRVNLCCCDIHRFSRAEWCGTVVFHASAGTLQMSHHSCENVRINCAFRDLSYAAKPHTSMRPLRGESQFATSQERTRKSRTRQRIMT